MGLSPLLIFIFPIKPGVLTNVQLCFRIRGRPLIQFKGQQTPRGNFGGTSTSGSAKMTHLIRHIKPFTIGMTVRARVAIEWRPRLFDSFEYDGLHYILVDQEGSCIHAMIEECYYGHVPKLMTVGQVYDISWFGSKRDAARQRVCPLDIILNFTAKTEFKQVEEEIPTIPRYAFRFVEFAQLHREAEYQPVLADFYGCIKVVKEPLEVAVRNSTRKRTRTDVKFMFIGREEIKITLWGDVAQSFPIEEAIESPEPMLAVFTAMRITKYEGNVGASSTNHTCILLNPQIEQTAQYRAEFSRPGDKLIVSGAYSKLPMSGHIDETDMKTVAELKTLDPALHISKSVYCAATVVRCFAEKGWWYNSCSHDKCYKVLIKKEESEDEYLCSLHGRIKPKQSYRVFIIIEDEHDQASITLMGRVAEEFFLTSCEDLPKKRFYPTESTLPPEISCRIGQKFLFEINMNQHGQFFLRSTCEDPKIDKQPIPAKQVRKEPELEVPTLETPQKSPAAKRGNQKNTAKKLFLDEISKEGN